MIKTKPLEWTRCPNTDTIMAHTFIEVGTKLKAEVRYFIEPTQSLSGYDAIIHFMMKTDFKHTKTLEEAKAYCEQENQEFWEQVYNQMLSKVIE